jgi:hypothetical protein
MVDNRWFFLSLVAQAAKPISILCDQNINAKEESFQTKNNLIKTDERSLE